MVENPALHHEIESSTLLPEVIQGGMGVCVSNWELARAVALAGEKHNWPVLGVVSGTGLPIIMTNRLRNGDQNTRRALEAFPVPQISQEILSEYWQKTQIFKLPPKPQVLISGSKETQVKMIKLLIAANFVEVWLAKEGHKNPIGVNYLEKIQLPRLPEIYGAMLAGVDYVLMGAGIPNQVPAVLDNFANNEPASYKVDVIGAENRHEMSFDPKSLIHSEFLPQLKRPVFYAIVSSHVLAQALALKVEGVDGFIVEGPTAGGHNAPARGKEINERGEPVYGPKDVPDLDKIRELRKPFWLAGGYASREMLAQAQQAGAAGVQVGSAFALSAESGIMEEIKQQLREKILDGSLDVLASAIASPSGYPFQVAQLEGTLADSEIYEERKRVCSLGYLVEAYQTESGDIGFRCPAGPIAAYIRKGGKEENTHGRVCICNGLAATVGHAKPAEPPIVTIGQELDFLKKLIQNPDGYSAEYVLSSLLTE